MNEDTAFEIVNEYKEKFGIVGMLETLQYMQISYNDLWEDEKTAYRIVMAGFRKLFAPKKESV